MLFYEKGASWPPQPDFGKGAGGDLKKIFILGAKENFKNYQEALESCGASPVFSENLAQAADCHGLLLPGGGDVEPLRYGEKNTGESCKIDLRRDEIELEAIRLFQRTGRPILGICRGLQILNVALGGSLIQDLSTAEAHRWKEETGDQIHLIHAEPGSFLFDLYGPRFPVNSAHHQGIRELAPSLSPVAFSEDGVLEAAAAPKQGFYAVQFHPERMCAGHSRPDTIDGQAIFDFFLRIC